MAFFRGVQSLFYEKSSCALFDFHGNFKKGAGCQYPIPGRSPGNGPDSDGSDWKKEYDIDVKAGTYTFKEVNFSNLEITWTLELQEDGTYTLTEEKFLVGRQPYPGVSWTVVDGVVICGKMDPGPEYFDWANPAGFSVRISGETFEFSTLPFEVEMQDLKKP